MFAVPNPPVFKFHRYTTLLRGGSVRPRYRIWCTSDSRIVSNIASHHASHHGERTKIIVMPEIKKCLNTARSLQRFPQSWSRLTFYFIPPIHRCRTPLEFCSFTLLTVYSSRPHTFHLLQLLFNPRNYGSQNYICYCARHYCLQGIVWSGSANEVCIYSIPSHISQC